jgi:hypothetical protein
MADAPMLTIRAAWDGPGDLVVGDSEGVRYID